MTNSGTIAVLIIIANIAFSYKGFTNDAFFNAYKFEVAKILINKDYKRFFTSGFLHVGWTHLIFNMISLLFFSSSVEGYLGDWQFLVVYMSGLLGGSLFSLLVHRHHSDYSAVGASGAVCGIIFASVALFPGMSIHFFGIPIPIPGWLYGVVYIGYSIYGVKSSKDNIGHDAHLGGALAGMMVALLFAPSAFAENYPTILMIAVPTMLFIYLIITRPHLLLVDNFFFKTHPKYYSVDHRYNAEKKSSQDEIDRILDKINRTGMKSLSSKEKQKLKEYAQQ